ncbi:MAG TPA: hypothetical protein VFT29_15680 [Gemmatimonadaceae bacterium]|nr:hypothetical protein [Gemmatimonadaceae bacterium]
MKNRLAALMLGSALTVLVGTSCSTPDGSLSPISQGPAASENLVGGLVGGLLGTVTGLLVPPVNRTTPLADDVTWSFVAGPGGAVSSNAAVGLTISIPAGALSSTQTITVTALEGSPVAYKFEPHGLVFAKDVKLTQNLRGTTAGGLLSLPLISGAYFATDRLELQNGLAVVTEILPAVSDLLTKTVTFPIKHFSGYIAASGRGDAGEGY